MPGFTLGTLSGGAEGPTIVTSVSTMSGGADAFSGTRTVRIGVGKFTRTDITPAVSTYPKAGTRIDCLELDLHVRGGDDQLRELVHLLPLAPEDDEDRGRPRLRLDRRYLPRRVHHHQSRQPGELDQVPESFRFHHRRRRAQAGLVHQVLWPDRRQFHPAARGAVASGLDVRRQAQHRADQRHPDGRRSDDRIVPAELRHPVDRRLLEQGTAGRISPAPRWQPGQRGRRLLDAAVGAFDGNLCRARPRARRAGGAGTLADVAMYYYKNDLRTTRPVRHRQRADHQQGQQRHPAHGDVHRSAWDSTASSPTARLRDRRAPAISPPSRRALKNWPSPGGDTPTALDDLWHAAVNGRGVFF